MWKQQVFGTCHTFIASAVERCVVSTVHRRTLVDHQAEAVSTIIAIPIIPYLLTAAILTHYGTSLADTHGTKITLMIAGLFTTLGLIHGLAAAWIRIQDVSPVLNPRIYRQRLSFMFLGFNILLYYLPQDTYNLQTIVPQLQAIAFGTLLVFLSYSVYERLAGQ